MNRPLERFGLRDSSAGRAGHWLSRVILIINLMKLHNLQRTQSERIGTVLTSREWWEVGIRYSPNMCTSEKSCKYYPNGRSHYKGYNIRGKIVEKVNH